MKRFKLLLILYVCFDFLLGYAGFIPGAETAAGQAAAPPSNLSRASGRFYAPAYAFGVNPNVPPLKLASGNTATGSQTLNLVSGAVTGFDGRPFYPLQVGNTLTFDVGANAENVILTAVSNCNSPIAFVQNCAITGSFNNLHGAGSPVATSTAGLQEAIFDATLAGGVNSAGFGPGGVVTVDQYWFGAMGGTTAIITGALVFPNVSIEDDRNGPPVFWNATPAAATTLSAPIALVAATAFSSTTTAGSASYTGGTIHVCYTLVDIMGNEGPCSADYSFTDTSAKAIQFTSPPAATGAIGWIPYIGLESGASAHESQVALVTQPTVIGAVPVAVSGLCTLTTIETTTPACALTNATYGQTGSAATVVAYPVVTSPQALGTGGLSTASYYIGNNNSRTVYSYEPGASIGTPGLVKSSGTFGITTAAASTVPQILGTLTIPAGFMNYVGRTIEVCGLAYSSTQGASTIVSIEFEWDAQGSDVTTSLPVIIGGPLITNTLTTGTVASFDFCQDIITTVASASATGGSLLAGHGYLIESALTSGSTPAAGPTLSSAAIGSLNLAEAARLHVVMVQTTSATAVPKLLNLTVKVLN